MYKRALNVIQLIKGWNDVHYISISCPFDSNDILFFKKVDSFFESILSKKFSICKFISENPLNLIQNSHTSLFSIYIFYWSSKDRSSIVDLTLTLDLKDKVLSFGDLTWKDCFIISSINSCSTKIAGTNSFEQDSNFFTQYSPILQIYRLSLANLAGYQLFKYNAFQLGLSQWLIPASIIYQTSNLTNLFSKFNQGCPITQNTLLDSNSSLVKIDFLPNPSGVSMIINVLQNDLFFPLLTFFRNSNITNFNNKLNFPVTLSPNNIPAELIFNESQFKRFSLFQHHRNHSDYISVLPQNFDRPIPYPSNLIFIKKSSINNIFPDTSFNSKISRFDFNIPIPIENSINLEDSNENNTKNINTHPNNKLEILLKNFPGLESIAKCVAEIKKDFVELGQKISSFSGVEHNHTDLSEKLAFGNIDHTESNCYPINEITNQSTAESIPDSKKGSLFDDLNNISAKLDESLTWESRIRLKSNPNPYNSPVSFTHKDSQSDNLNINIFPSASNSDDQATNADSTLNGNLLKTSLDDEKKRKVDCLSTNGHHDSSQPHLVSSNDINSLKKLKSSTPLIEQLNFSINSKPQTLLTALKPPPSVNFSATLKNNLSANDMLHTSPTVLNNPGLNSTNNGFNGFDSDMIHSIDVKTDIFSFNPTHSPLERDFLGDHSNLGMLNSGLKSKFSMDFESYDMGINDTDFGFFDDFKDSSLESHTFLIDKNKPSSIPKQSTVLSPKNQLNSQQKIASNVSNTLFNSTIKNTNTDLLKPQNITTNVPHDEKITNKLVSSPRKPEVITLQSTQFTSTDNNLIYSPNDDNLFDDFFAINSDDENNTNAYNELQLANTLDNDISESSDNISNKSNKSSLNTSAFKVSQKLLLESKSFITTEIQSDLDINVTEKISLDDIILPNLSQPDIVNTIKLSTQQQTSNEFTKSSININSEFATAFNASSNNVHEIYTDINVTANTNPDIITEPHSNKKIFVSLEVSAADLSPKLENIDTFYDTDKTVQTIKDLDLNSYVSSTNYFSTDATSPQDLPSTLPSESLISADSENIANLANYSKANTDKVGVSKKTDLSFTALESLSGNTTKIDSKASSSAYSLIPPQYRLLNPSTPGGTFVNYSKHFIPNSYYWNEKRKNPFPISNFPDNKFSLNHSARCYSLCASEPNNQKSRNGLEKQSFNSLIVNNQSIPFSNFSFKSNTEINPTKRNYSIAGTLNRSNNDYRISPVSWAVRSIKRQNLYTTLNSNSVTKNAKIQPKTTVIDHEGLKQEKNVECSNKFVYWIANQSINASYTDINSKPRLPSVSKFLQHTLGYNKRKTSLNGITRISSLKGALNKSNSDTISKATESIQSETNHNQDNLNEYVIDICDTQNAHRLSYDSFAFLESQAVGTLFQEVVSGSIDLFENRVLTTILHLESKKNSKSSTDNQNQSFPNVFNSTNDISTKDYSSDIYDNTKDLSSPSIASTDFSSFLHISNIVAQWAAFSFSFDNFVTRSQNLSSKEIKIEPLDNCQLVTFSVLNVFSNHMVAYSANNENQKIIEVESPLDFSNVILDFMQFANLGFSDSVVAGKTKTQASFKKKRYNDNNQPSAIVAEPHRDNCSEADNKFELIHTTPSYQLVVGFLSTSKSDLSKLELNSNLHMNQSELSTLSNPFLSISDEQLALSCLISELEFKHLRMLPTSRRDHYTLLNKIFKFYLESNQNLTLDGCIICSDTSCDNMLTSSFLNPIFSSNRSLNYNSGLKIEIGKQNFDDSINQNSVSASLIDQDVNVIDKSSNVTHNLKLIDITLQTGNLHDTISKDSNILKINKASIDEKINAVIGSPLSQNSEHCDPPNNANDSDSVEEGEEIEDVYDNDDIVVPNNFGLSETNIPTYSNIQQDESKLNINLEIMSGDTKSSENFLDSLEYSSSYEIFQEIDAFSTLDLTNLENNFFGLNQKNILALNASALNSWEALPISPIGGGKSILTCAISEYESAYSVKSSLETLLSAYSSHRLAVQKKSFKDSCYCSDAVSDGNIDQNESTNQGLSSDLNRQIKNDDAVRLNYMQSQQSTFSFYSVAKSVLEISSITDNSLLLTGQAFGLMLVDLMLKFDSVGQLNGTISSDSQSSNNIRSLKDKQSSKYDGNNNEYEEKFKPYYHSPTQMLSKKSKEHVEKFMAPYVSSLMDNSNTSSKNSQQSQEDLKAFAISEFFKATHYFSSELKQSVYNSIDFGSDSSFTSRIDSFIKNLDSASMCMLVQR
ncbi:hypothetical protein BB561_001430 [Smittium simulii]|uniref:Uncharacterized protein n=1 Tax=Smittium simulii TaxID=133385 RepID=A0A2T9YUL5_9FUNG|nr:hypothetical protein BB561_001430 [Smittium simulii]